MNTAKVYLVNLLYQRISARENNAEVTITKGNWVNFPSTGHNSFTKAKCLAFQKKKKAKCLIVQENKNHVVSHSSSFDGEYEV